MLVSVMSVTAFAAEGDVAGAVEDTWIAARGQIKSVVNKVIFPIIDLVLAVLFFVRFRLHTSITASTGSSNGVRRRFFSPPWSSH